MARKSNKGKSKGRQKINMVKMENESNLQVTFSKRRTGLFKKASELCTLCAADVAIIVFSPGQKAFSFGHPCVEAVIDRFLTRDPPPTSGTHQFIQAHRNANLRELNKQFSQLEGIVEAEKKRGQSIEQMMVSRRSQRWWEAPLEELSLEQLQELETAMESFKDNLDNKANRMMVQAVVSSANTSSSSNTRGFPFGSSTSIVPFDARASTGSISSLFPFDAVLPWASGSTTPFDFRGSRDYAVPFNYWGSGSRGGVIPNFGFRANASTSIVPYDPRASGSSSDAVSFGGNNASGLNGGGGLFDIVNAIGGSSSSSSYSGGSAGVNEFNGSLPLDVLSASGFTGGGVVSFDATRAKEYFNGGLLINAGANEVTINGGGLSNDTFQMAGGSDGGAFFEAGPSGSNSGSGFFEAGPSGSNEVMVPFDDRVTGASGSLMLHGFEDDQEFFRMS